MPPRVTSVLQLATTVFASAAVLVFATGFFPYKPFIPGLAQHDNSEFGQAPKPQFDRLIFMVVDALRSDFVYSERSGFQFTQSLIRDGSALPFTAHATSPTITMPRIKAITTGSIPSFLDVILNFAESDTSSTLANQDTWLAQIKAKNNGRLVMYGDDTWLKLFPGMFARADGTSSFFVSDFFEVDNNVTRHVPDELKNDDWNAMILHYLGLDHIGHKTGPNGPDMIPKQTEMDGMVEQIYRAIETEPHLGSTLFVVCGDHGMNEVGNHGGSAPGETSPALLFISPKLKTGASGRLCPTTPKQDFEYYKLVEQSDVAPTIAGLLGLPVPLNNLGVFIEDFLPLWSGATDQAHLLWLNAIQILKIVKATFPGEDYDGLAAEVDCSQLPDGAELACLWRRVALSATTLKSGNSLSAVATTKALYEFCRKSQDTMSSTASNYDVQRLVSGVSLALLSVGLTLGVSWPTIALRSTSFWFYALVTALYGIMMFASSYVEEEHHFWYWVTAGWFGVLRLLKLQHISRKAAPGAVQFQIFVLLALHRIVQRWNQTGQKHAGAPDIVRGYLMPNPQPLWLLVFATYVAVVARIGRHFAVHMSAGLAVGSSCSVMLCVPALAFKLAFTASDAPELVNWLNPDFLATLQQVALVSIARVVFYTLTLDVVWASACRWYAKGKRISGPNLLSTIHDLLTLLLITQTRVHNIPLYLLFIVQMRMLRALRLTPTQITLSTILLAQVSFFALGNSNAISGIDLGNAYNGVSGYNVVAVGILLFISNWAGPIWWSVAGVVLLVDSARPAQSAISPSPPVQAATADVWAGNDKSGKQKRSWVSQEHRLLAPVVDLNSESATSSREPSREEAANAIRAHLALQSLFTMAALLAVMLACTILRTHLFIWTVFSPKYLYAMAWNLVFHLLVTLGGGWAMWKVGMLED